MHRFNQQRLGIALLLLIITGIAAAWQQDWLNNAELSSDTAFTSSDNHSSVGSAATASQPSATQQQHQAAAATFANTDSHKTDAEFTTVVATVKPSLAATKAATNTRSNSATKRSTTDNDDSGLGDFLQMAYQQALIEDPALAAEISETLQQHLSDNTAASSNGNSTTNDNDNSDELSQQSADELADNDCQTLGTCSDTPAYCQQRPPSKPGQFRCPCPGDVDWRPNWRDFYNPDLIANMNCQA